MTKKDATFLVRLPKETLDALNRVVEANAINRSALVRKWIDEYIKEHGEGQR